MFAGCKDANSLIGYVLNRRPSTETGHREREEQVYYQYNTTQNTPTKQE